VRSGYGKQREGSETISKSGEESVADYGKRGKAEVAVARPQYANHIVQAGDTLYSISKRYAVSVNDLKRWNYLYDNNLAVGQELTVKTESFNK